MRVERGPSSARWNLVHGLRHFATVHGTEKEAEALVALYTMAYWLVNGDPRQAAGETLKNLKTQAKKILRVLPTPSVE